MARIGNCPFGFEDGHVVGYEANGFRLVVCYEFWNEQQGMLAFEGFIGLRDSCAIGVDVGEMIEVASSDFINALIRRLFERPPNIAEWKHFAFLDVDEQPMLEVVAESCVFHAAADLS